MQKYKQNITLLLLLALVGCQIETYYLESNNLVNLQQIEKLQSNQNGIQQTEIIDDYSHPIFNQFISNNEVSLAVNTKYIFSVPILLNNLNELIIEGNGSTLCFPINGIGIQIDYSSNIKIQNLIIENTNENGQAYYSYPEQGRINITNSDNIIVDNIDIKEQGFTPNNHLNHIQIMVYNSTFCDILNSTIQNSYGELIVIDGSNDCKVINNKTFNGESGIATKGRILSWYRGYRTLIKDNYVYSTSTASITINDRQTIVENNQIEADSLTNIGGPGIRFGHYRDSNDIDYVHLRAKNCVARFNTISNFLSPTTDTDGDVVGGSSATGIKIDASIGTDGYGNIIIENNNIKNCKRGVTVSGAPGQLGEINNNQIAVDAEAIDIFSADENNLADFKILNNEITTKENNYNNGNDYAIRISSSNSDIKHNIVNLNSSYKYAKAIEIRRNNLNAKVNIIGNELNVNGNYGVHHTDYEMNNSNIENNIITHSRVGMLLKSKNSLISENNIINASDYGMLFWDGAENCTVTNNSISVSYSAAIRLHNTENINVAFNIFELLAGQSLYSVYKSAYNYNPTINNNLHNWQYQSN